MAYTEAMLASIKKVEETRSRRMSEKIPLLSAEDKKSLLRSFHPDYNPMGKRPVQIGPNEGDLMPNELVDLLEAYPRVDPNKFNLNSFDYDVDILVIGGGGAGASA
ncbi:MAG TPA: succinate dehydrogenase/fumarate reductase flavoprotein subunit, partial [bacterium (Candidatus Stahlbacteria)]|nr:succinate dehydrogenase/fumarate reductase flavoprotein subunit [Candidatus Stahlbacteria bacterium]